MGLFAFVCPFVYCCARVRIEMAGEMRKKLYREYRFLIPPGAVATLWCCLLFCALETRVAAPTTTCGRWPANKLHVTA